MRHVDCVVGIDKQGNVIIHLLFIRVVKFVKGLEIFHVAGLDAGLYAVIVTVGEYHLKGSAHIEERRVVPAFRFTGFLRFHAADDIIIPRIFQR